SSSTAWRSYIPTPIAIALPFNVLPWYAMFAISERVYPKGSKRQLTSSVSSSQSGSSVGKKEESGMGSNPRSARTYSGNSQLSCTSSLHSSYSLPPLPPSASLKLPISIPVMSLPMLNCCIQEEETNISPTTLLTLDVRVILESYVQTHPDNRDLHKLGLEWKNCMNNARMTVKLEEIVWACVSVAVLSVACEEVERATLRAQHRKKLLDKYGITQEEEEEEEEEEDEADIDRSVLLNQIDKELDDYDREIIPNLRKKWNSPSEGLLSPIPKSLSDASSIGLILESFFGVLILVKSIHFIADPCGLVMPGEEEEGEEGEEDEELDEKCDVFLYSFRDFLCEIKRVEEEWEDVSKNRKSIESISALRKKKQDENDILDVAKRVDVTCLIGVSNLANAIIQNISLRNLVSDEYLLSFCNELKDCDDEIYPSIELAHKWLTQENDENSGEYEYEEEEEGEEEEEEESN
ncbi:hypothetical protein ADUPG1_011142, partial [Aduncisulcus paluster]